MISFLKKFLGSAQDRAVLKYQKMVGKINAFDSEYDALSDSELRAKTEEFKSRLEKGETVDDLLFEAYAVVKNTCKRLIGTDIHVSGYDQKWDMIPYDVQLVGGMAMHYGAIAEMMTGEGKTLTASLPLYLNALTGKPVHLVTVNDYLAERDCQWTGSILRWHGLTTGALTNATPVDKRKEIYQCDVVYGTASEFGFDYLRDNSMVATKNQQVQRGYFFSIIDEVDSVLVDEARTPLIISGPAPESKQMYDELKGKVGALVRNQRDFCNRIATEARRVVDRFTSESTDNPPKDELEEAYKKLWIVSKGVPRHKILLRMQENPDVRSEIDNVDLYYHGEQGKFERLDALADLMVIIDERSSDYELTDRGIQEWSRISGNEHSDDFTMMDISDEFIKIEEDNSLSDEEKVERRIAVQDEDQLRKERTHNLRQLLRAHLLMEKDVDYILQNEKIVIIDENTGRPQPGRRFSDGLHQAIEAKEGVAIQKETQTYATITLQNYFRMYDKLSGMTGTAVTEAGEFKEIYKLDVLQIPTHKPCVRDDCNDEIYMTEREKYGAILKSVEEEHAKGRPILIGTESVDISEKLSRIFRQRGLNHVVLNAKHHTQEAEIVAAAGGSGTITIATNMAGRGTDIKLGAGSKEAGGLYVVGTTRHPSRRIDRQLQGRGARQGDPGSSRFYVSFEDQLMRRFSSPGLNSMLKRFRPPEGEPISAGVLNKSIETAQKRVEQRNYAIRKHTLQYDDVMNKQRQEIYSFRNAILHSNDIIDLAKESIEEVIAETAEKYVKEGEGFRQWLIEHFPVQVEEGLFERSQTVDELIDESTKIVLDAFEAKLEREDKKVFQPEGFQPGRDSPVEYAVRNLMTQELDRLWMRHLLSMDHLRSDVTLRTVGQRDPLMEFKQEAFNLFQELSIELSEEIAHKLFKFELVSVSESELQAILGQIQMETKRSLVEEDFSEPEPPKEEIITPVSAANLPGRNDPCSCGSGKKYKKCCGTREELGVD